MASRNHFFSKNFYKVDYNISNSNISEKSLVHSSSNIHQEQNKFAKIKEPTLSNSSSFIINGNIKRVPSPQNKSRPFYSRDKITPEETSQQLKGLPIVFIKNSDPTSGVNSNEYQKLVKNIKVLLTQTKITIFNVDNYKMIKQIGEGSYGIIYLVEENKSHKKCALKKIIAHDYEEVQAFLNEFSLVHSIHHDNIMKIYGICIRVLDITTIAINVLMEMANADWDTDIRKHKEKNKRYSEKELISILKQLVEALAHLQANKISHRDIKPQNVLIYRHGVFKMADFGEAKEVKVAKQVNTVRGTEYYMSPILYESVKQNCDDVKHNSFKSDVFSLGYCFIYAAMLNFKIIYDIREITNMKDIENIVKGYLKNYYSQRFIECLVKMIEIDEKKRMDFLQLKEYINKHFNEETN